MNFIGIIPARYSSSRFPGKPLVMINGKSMIQRVYEQAEKADVLSDIIVATDDERINNHVKNFNGKVMMTSPHHQSGTERCNEVIEHLKKSSPGNILDVVINIQGDEPLIDPVQIKKVASCFTNKNIQIATLLKKISSNEELFNFNIVKSVFDKNNQAIYFSRQPIPFLSGKKNSEWLNFCSYYKHIGVYAYRADILKEITNLKPSPLEIAESLEQLRWIENGYKINIALTDIESYAVDSPEDLKKIINKT
ncbi:MAG: 3-deoxy-manno-octulosonate cytidylyltransferase [Bacteroidales bacterium]|nr:3-deoxy-manno-octulosonate cytidylyltransferase [Bacteroidales bacterium]